MQIGVVGDTHNRMPNVEKMVALFREARIERLIHTGDITQPKVLDAFAQLNVPIHAVFGNNDEGERDALVEQAAHLGVELVDPPHHLHWADRRILIVHDPEHAPPDLIEAADLLVHGHTHRHRQEVQRGTLIFNPGECAGFRAGANAVGLVDLVRLEASRLHF